MQEVNIVLDLVVYLDCKEKKKLGIAFYVQWTNWTNRMTLSVLRE